MRYTRSAWSAIFSRCASSAASSDTGAFVPPLSNRLIVTEKTWSQSATRSFSQLGSLGQRRVWAQRPLRTGISAFKTHVKVSMMHTWKVAETSVRIPNTCLRIEAFPLFQDNYSYVLLDDSQHNADRVVVAIDPADPDTFLEYLQQRLSIGQPTHVLTTHKHWDHAGGNSELARRFPGLVIYGGASEDVPACTSPVHDGDEFRIAQSRLLVRVLSTPCHTRGHVCYYVRDAQAPSSAPGIVFTGDTLFIGGCGRFFEGTGAHMLQAMQKLSTLPPETFIFCGHEYTVANLEFALTVEPTNDAIKEKLKEAQRMRADNKATIPSTIGGEQQWNVFLRASDAHWMTELRERKNRFRS
ncbi:hypothetical protein F1559_000797 [Cyanidiococcus yangmingshanensis]|uniref:hydroxyacylglutathione hydrolase n=1 Tax=Cyanidiococcus yangmingshanensis TaxID=2690220 RepID=A0A7J7IRE4_9RHOD|nr:hypothetical protein F1559_000797 [Cyanidiococcus yangmingshanensis]